MNENTPTPDEPRREARDDASFDDDGLGGGLTRVMALAPAGSFIEIAKPVAPNRAAVCAVVFHRPRSGPYFARDIALETTDGEPVAWEAAFGLALAEILEVITDGR